MVGPRLAHDTEATVSQAAELWKIVDRPNLFIKIPATTAGMPAISAAVAAGNELGADRVVGEQPVDRCGERVVVGRFDEQSGMTLHDATGNGHTATIVSGITFGVPGATGASTKGIAASRLAGR